MRPINRILDASRTIFNVAPGQALKGCRCGYCRLPLEDKQHISLGSPRRQEDALRWCNETCRQMHETRRY